MAISIHVKDMVAISIHVKIQVAISIHLKDISGHIYACKGHT